MPDSRIPTRFFSESEFTNKMDEQKENMVLTQLQTDIAVIRERLETFIKIHEASLLQVCKKSDDHEKRIRFLERYAYVLLGIFFLVQAGLAFIK